VQKLLQFKRISSKIKYYKENNYENINSRRSDISGNCLIGPSAKGDIAMESNGKYQ
jgi:hypothetical protein